MKRKRVVKPVKSPGKSRTTLKQFEKKPGKHIYYVNLPKGEKTNSEIKKRIDDLNFTRINRGDLPDEYVKITFVAKKNEKEKQAFTNIYFVDDLEDVTNSISAIWHDITTKPPKNGKDYMKRINRLRGFVNTIIIDFETAANK